MDTTRTVAELRAKAAKYRAMARMTNAETAKRILELTVELEQQACEIEREN